MASWTRRGVHRAGAALLGAAATLGACSPNVEREYSAAETSSGAHDRIFELDPEGRSLDFALFEIAHADPGQVWLTNGSSDPHGGWGSSERTSAPDVSDVDADGHAIAPEPEDGLEDADEEGGMATLAVEPVVAIPSEPSPAWLCYGGGTVEVPADCPVSTTLDDQTHPQPDWVHSAYLAVRAAACGAANPNVPEVPASCADALYENPQICDVAAYYYTSPGPGRIRYSAERLEGLATRTPSLGGVDTEATRVFFTGILAHEFGHFASVRRGVPPTGRTRGDIWYEQYFQALRAHGVSAGEGEQVREELFGDFVAGCVLSRMQNMTKELIDAFAGGLATLESPAGYPPPAARERAVSLGFDRCASPQMRVRLGGAVEARVHAALSE